MPAGRPHLVHHELCFGCGRTNLFGLLLEAEEDTPASVNARCFIKQDHQGAEPGAAHEGVIAAALSEAMTLAGGPGTRVQRLEVEVIASVPVGTFLDVSAQADGARGTAAASADGKLVAKATATLRQSRDG